MTYSEWLTQQTPERQDASLTLMMACQRLGELNRTTPRCEEAVQLSQQIREHYRTFG